MKGEFIQVNGDNLFKADLVKVLLDAPIAPVTVAINHKPAYDADDMKVMMDGERLTEIGKTLPSETVNAEAIGFYVFRAEGAKAYADTLDRAMREPSGLKQWFPGGGRHAGETHSGAHRGDRRHSMVRSRFSGRSAAGTPARLKLVVSAFHSVLFPQAPCLPACRRRRPLRRKA